MKIWSEQKKRTSAGMWKHPSKGRNVQRTRETKRNHNCRVQPSSVGLQLSARGCCGVVSNQPVRPASCRDSDMLGQGPGLGILHLSCSYSLSGYLNCGFLMWKHFRVVVVSCFQSCRDKQTWLMMRWWRDMPVDRSLNSIQTPSLHFPSLHFCPPSSRFTSFGHWLPDTGTRIIAFIFKHFHSFSLLSSIRFPLADPIPFLPPPSLACHYLIFAHLSSLYPPIRVSPPCRHLSSSFCPSVLGSSSFHFPSTPTTPSVPLYPPDFSRAPSPPSPLSCGHSPGCWVRRALAGGVMDDH